MPNWTVEDYERYLADKAATVRKRKVAGPERIAGPAPDGSLQVKEGHSAPLLVRVTDRRVNLLDPDGMVAKYHIDCLRYSGLIHDDTVKEIEVSVRQEKVAHFKDEETIIEITTL